MAGIFKSTFFALLPEHYMSEKSEYKKTHLALLNGFFATCT